MAMCLCSIPSDHLLPKHAEGGSRFQRLEILGNALDIHPPSFDLLQDRSHLPGVQRIPGIDHFGIFPPPLWCDPLNDRTRRIVGTADAYQNEDIRLLTNFFRLFLDLRKDIFSCTGIYLQPVRTFRIFEGKVLHFPQTGQMMLL